MSVSGKGGLAPKRDCRWYDPAISRPLQPNTAGAPPTMPQALNRYTAGVAGQPGVFEAARNDSFNWIPPGVSFAYGTAAQLAGARQYVKSSLITGYALIEVTGSHHAVTRRIPAHLRKLFTNPILAYSRGGRDFYTRQYVRSVARGSVESLEAATDSIVMELHRTLPREGAWAATVNRQIQTRTWEFRGLVSEKPNWVNIGRLGHALNFGLEFGFQFAEDRQNPYLTPGQVWSRSITSGAAGTVLSGVAAAGGFALCGPPCAVVGGVGGGVVWSVWIKPMVFQAVPGFRPADRNLMPLINP